MTSQQCHPHQPFSTLQAVRVAATLAADHVRNRSIELSVPSKRVESLQPLGYGTQFAPDFDFQYPPSGSSRCNRAPILATRGTLSLSVPSKRVESLQPTLLIISPINLMYFQYPPSGSSRCNNHDTCPARTYRVFQYPPSGSSRCNQHEFGEWLDRPNLSVPSKRVESLQRWQRRQACQIVVLSVI